MHLLGQPPYGERLVQVSGQTAPLLGLRSSQADSYSHSAEPSSWVTLKVEPIVEDDVSAAFTDTADCGLLPQGFVAMDDFLTADELAHWREVVDGRRS